MKKFKATLKNPWPKKADKLIREMGGHIRPFIEGLDDDQEKATITWNKKLKRLTVTCLRDGKKVRMRWMQKTKQFCLPL